jgi:hypothetical protein
MIMMSKVLAHFKGENAADTPLLMAEQYNQSLKEEYCSNLAKQLHVKVEDRKAFANTLCSRYSVDVLAQYDNAIFTMQNVGGIDFLDLETTQGYELLEEGRQGLKELGILTPSHPSLIPFIQSMHVAQRTGTGDACANFLEQYKSQLVALTEANRYALMKPPDAGHAAAGNQLAPDTELNQAALAMYSHMYKAVEAWKQQGLEDIQLVIVGELHDCPAIYMAKLMLIDIAEKFDIKHLVVEASPETLAHAQINRDLNLNAPLLLDVQGNAASFGEANNHIFFAHLLKCAVDKGMEVIAGDVPKQQVREAEFALREAVKAASYARDNPPQTAEEAARVQALRNTVVTKLLHERDDHIARQIPEGQPCLLILGKAHLPGVAERIIKAHPYQESENHEIELKPLAPILAFDMAPLAVPSTRTVPRFIEPSERDLPQTRKIVMSGHADFNYCTPAQVKAFAEGAALAHTSVRQQEAERITAQAEEMVGRLEAMAASAQKTYSGATPPATGVKVSKETGIG